MSLYALPFNGLVAELFTPPAGFTLDQCFTPAMAAEFVDVTSVNPAPQVGWTATESGGTWTFAAPAPPPAPSLAQQAQDALAAGLTITSTGTPSLNGTYDVSAAAQSHMQAEMIALLNSSGASFADGTATVAWPDMSGADHTFSATEGKAFYLAAGAYVAALYKCMNGTLTTLPAATATIP